MFFPSRAFDGLFEHSPVTLIVEAVVREVVFPVAWAEDFHDEHVAVDFAHEGGCGSVNVEGERTARLAFDRLERMLVLNVDRKVRNRWLAQFKLTIHNPFPKIRM